jgi:hypothetical protein
VSDLKAVLICNIVSKSAFVAGGCYMAYLGHYKLAGLCVIAGLFSGSDYNSNPKEKDSNNDQT